MAYLHLNGYAVPVAHASKASFEEVSARRAYTQNAHYIFSRSALVRAWRFQTAILGRADLAALSGMLNSLGDGWRWDLSSSANGVYYITGATDQEAYSDMRRPSKALESVATVMSAYGADGSRVYDWNGNAYAPFAGCEGAVLVELASQNRASANQFNPSATTGFGNIGTGVTLSNSPDNAWIGSTCVAATLPGSVQAEGIATIAFTGRTSYVISGFIKLSPSLITAAKSVRCQLYDTTAAASLDYNDITPTDQDGWYRVFAAGSPAGGAGSNVEFRIFIGSNDTAGVMYLDGVQSEDDVGDGYPTAPVAPGSNPWGSGSGIRPNGVLDYDTFLSTYTRGLTVSAWVNLQRLSPASNTLVWAGADTNPRPLLLMTTSNEASFQVFAADGSNLTTLSSAKTAGWHHLVGVYDPVSASAKLYVDGALASTDTTWSGNRTRFDIAGISGDLSIGTAGTAGATWSPGPIGPLIVYPFAATASIIAGWYNNASDNVPVPGVLPLAAHGDFLSAGEESIKAHAKVEDITTVPHFDPVTGAWDDGGGRMSFSLFEEVGR